MNRPCERCGGDAWQIVDAYLKAHTIEAKHVA